MTKCQVELLEVRPFIISFIFRRKRNNQSSFTRFNSFYILVLKLHLETNLNEQLFNKSSTNCTVIILHINAHFFIYVMPKQ